MSKERIGVYVCHCGTNISSVVDVEDVKVWAGEALADSGVVVSRDYQFMCIAREAGVNVCRPMWGSECPGRIPSCLMGHVSNTNARPGVCADTSGKWQRRKCVRKKMKGKCYKKRVQKHCKATCGLC